MTGQEIAEQLSYREDMEVTEYKSYLRDPNVIYDIYPVCPRCKETFEREYQQYCDRCGQKLAWNKYGK